MYVQFNEVLPIEDRGYHIGELSELFAVTLRTIRFYEERGLLAPRRVSARTRVYDRDDVARLSLIVGCRRFGLTVDEIGDLLEIRDRAGLETFEPALRTALRDRHAAMTTEIAEAEALRNQLAEWIADLDRAG